MTFEQASAQAAPFDECWVWTGVPRLDRHDWKHMFVVRTSDGKSTIFNFTASTCERQIRRVPLPGDLRWDYTLNRREGDDWHVGGLTEMLAWGRSLWK